MRASHQLAVAAGFSVAALAMIALAWSTRGVLPPAAPVVPARQHVAPASETADPPRPQAPLSPAMHDSGDMSPPAPPATVERVSADGDPQVMARARNVPLIRHAWQPTGDGACQQWHVSPHGLYAGCSAEVVALLERALSRREQDRIEAIMDTGLHPDLDFDAMLVGMLVRDPSADVRATAAEALATTENRASIDALVAAITDTDPLVQEHARASLSMIRSGYARRRLVEQRARLRDSEQIAIVDQILQQAYEGPWDDFDEDVEF